MELCRGSAWVGMPLACIMRIRENHFAIVPIVFDITMCFVSGDVGSSSVKLSCQPQSVVQGKKQRVVV